ncbi:MAG TPA: hypothetical protein VH478_00190 [Trebonia sp.]|jgi:hypothetical protein|nr:hypothetical protein [Trebonia sp.]
MPSSTRAISTSARVEAPELLAGLASSSMPAASSKPNAASSPRIRPACRSRWRPVVSGLAMMDRSPARVNMMPPIATTIET